MRCYVIHGPDDRPEAGGDAIRFRQRPRRLPIAQHLVYARALREAARGRNQDAGSTEHFKARDDSVSLKNPQSEGEHQGDPEALFANWYAAEANVTWVREQLKAVLTEAQVQ